MPTNSFAQEVQVLGSDADRLVHSEAYEASHVLLGEPGRLLSLIGYNSKTSTQFIQIHDFASLPADGSVPAIAPISVPASSNWSLDLPAGGIPFTSGIVVCNSSTGPTKTLGTTDCFFSAVVRAK